MNGQERKYIYAVQLIGVRFSLNISGCILRPSLLGRIISSTFSGLAKYSFRLLNVIVSTYVCAVTLSSRVLRYFLSFSCPFGVSSKIYEQSQYLATPRSFNITALYLYPSIRFRISFISLTLLKVLNALNFILLFT